jgi:hypothetical protein
MTQNKLIKNINVYIGYKENSIIIKLEIYMLEMQVFSK